MKKTLIAVAAAAALTTSAFAEITFGGWGRAIWAPVASMGGDAITFTSTSWGGDGRIGFGMDFTSENVDMHADFKLEDNKAEINDQLKVVVRPIENLSISIGKLQDDTLRGDCCYGSWNWLRPNWLGGMLEKSYKAEDEGLTFSRTIDLKGVAVKATPVEGLVILAGIPVAVNGYGDENIGNDGDARLAETAYKAAKVAFGYTIDGIGQIKAQFLGKGPGSDYGEDDTGDLEVAFKLSAVENLSAEVGFKMQILDDSDAAKKLVALGARYQVNDACAVAASAAVTLYGNSDYDPSMAFGAGVDYALDNGVGLCADVRVAMPQNDIDPSIGFMVGASKGFSNGKLSAGFQGVSVAEGSGTGLCGSLKPAKDGAYEADGFVWAVPVCFEYWF
ncbi:hypothetical protein [Treponema sp.]|uniref:hypothetical protein n=1 Tax=Treponema sp. TaxID=166 RepID=UPI00298DAF5B|nr:hypothetical protein [Treponema sp.]